MVLMSASDKKKWLSQKKTFLEKTRHQFRDALAQGKEAWDLYHKFMESHVDPNDQLDQEQFDVVKAAGKLNDYERDLLGECLEDKGRYFELIDPDEGVMYLALKTKLGVLKKYKELEFIQGYASLIRKKQLQKIEKTPNHFSPNWRGESVYKKAKELEKMEAEEIEGMKGLGSFYDFSSVL